MVAAATCRAEGNAESEDAVKLTAVVLRMPTAGEPACRRRCCSSVQSAYAGDREWPVSLNYSGTGQGERALSWDSWGSS
jgi:hypothetical protein